MKWLSSVFSGALSLLATPALNTLLEGWKAKLAADNDSDRIAADLAGRELVVQQRELELRSQERIALLGRWWEPANLLGYILVFYVAKVVLYDSILGLGETPAIRGAVGDWLGMVATFYVGTRGAISVASILRRR
jgi:hypothetical protein